MIGSETAALQAARKVADAVLYEGYLLYPYRASSQKNQMRWQFGVLMPQDHARASSEAETWFSQTECLMEPRKPGVIRVSFRCLQLQERVIEKAGDEGFEPVDSVTAGDRTYVTWDEAVEHEQEFLLSIDELTDGIVTSIELAETFETEEIRDPAAELVGRIVRRRWPVSGVIRVTAERLEAASEVLKLRIRVENLTAWADPSAGRGEALKRSLIAAHLLISTEAGRFISLLEPPQWIKSFAESCENVHTWPVLIGDDGRRDTMLSSPIILYDFPQVAPESPGDLFDATEIDEILSLRTAAMTDEEKSEARATDERAAAIIDRTDAMPPEIMERLHGTIRYVRDATGKSEPSPDEVPWWDPGADSSVSPETDSIDIDGVPVSKGSRVRLRPGSRRTDAQDLFLMSRTARVEAVFFDVEGNNHLAVTLEDDPAAELHQWHGRFLYFAPDEVEPLEELR
ncbi:MAG: hypothetical protein QOH48_1461 [Actinomycetota bacterium]|nr:hypothetical protein [Actinomycetota bacterium]